MVSVRSLVCTTCTSLMIQVHIYHITRKFHQFRHHVPFPPMQVHRFPTLCRDYQVARVKALLKRCILLYLYMYMYMHGYQCLLLLCMCINQLYYRPLVVDATQSRFKVPLMKAKRYIIPFDKCKLANLYIMWLCL